MSYQVLARKWRPKSFREMVGQEHVLRALIHSLDTQRLHHAYLFTGTRGVGKTTIGRILARCLNCEQGVSSQPCGVCSSCVEISEGRFVDLIEIDAASRTKVDDMRELLDNVQYAPTRARFKVYLIDEVHMLTTQSFNALLKTLEEPPEHVKFLFATTDPQKLPVTILSRCLQFNLKSMPAEKIVRHLADILSKENVRYEESALWLLARAAEGSMRDALSLTDQAISFCQGNLQNEPVSQMLGTVDHQRTLSLVARLAENAPARLLKEIREISEFAPNYKELLASIIDILNRVALEQMVPGVTENHLGDKEQIVQLARTLIVEDVQLWYQIALVGRKDLDLCPDQRAGFEMVMLRMLAFRPNIESGEVLGERKPIVEDRGEDPPRESSPDSSEGGDEKKNDEPVTGSGHLTDPGQPPEEAKVVEALAYSGGPEAEPMVQVSSETVDDEGHPAFQPVDVSVYEDDEPDMTETASERPPSAEQSGKIEVVNDGHVTEYNGQDPDQTFDWCRDYRDIGLSGMALNLAANMAWQEEDDGVQLQIEPSSARLLTGSHKKTIIEAIGSALEKRGVAMPAIRIEITEPKTETPAQRRQRLQEERRMEAVRTLREDPVVREVVELFSGTLDESSIEPVD